MTRAAFGWAALMYSVGVAIPEISILCNIIAVILLFKIRGKSAVDTSDHTFYVGSQAPERLPQKAPEKVYRSN